MPIIKSAIKKVRKDKVRTERNRKREAVMKTLVKKAKKEKTPKALSAVFSSLDKAAKVHLIHPNKAARLKSRLAKLMSQPSIASDSKSARLKPRLAKLMSQPSIASASKSARLKSRPSKLLAATKKVK